MFKAHPTAKKSRDKHLRFHPSFTCRSVRMVDGQQDSKPMFEQSVAMKLYFQNMLSQLLILNPNKLRPTQRNIASTHHAMFQATDVPVLTTRGAGPTPLRNSVCISSGHCSPTCFRFLQHLLGSDVFVSTLLMSFWAIFRGLAARQNN